MPIGVDHIDKLSVLRAKLLESDARLDSVETSLSLFVQNMTLTVVGGPVVLESAVEPPIPVSGQAIWKWVRAGQATVWSINGTNSVGVSEWQWFAETT